MQNTKSNKNKLTPKEHENLLNTLKARFKKIMNRK